MPLIGVNHVAFGRILHISYTTVQGPPTRVTLKGQHNKTNVE